MQVTRIFSLILHLPIGTMVLNATVIGMYGLRVLFARLRSIETELWKGMTVSTAVMFFLIFALNPMGVFSCNGFVDALKMAGGILIVPVALTAAYTLAPVLRRCHLVGAELSVAKRLSVSLALSLLVMAVELVYDLAAYDVVLTASYLRFYVGCALLLAPTPIVVSSLLMRNMQLKRNLSEANEINRRLLGLRRNGTSTGTIDCGTTVDNGLITFTDGAKEPFTVRAASVLYGEAVGNYVKLHYLPKGATVPTAKLLRITVKEAISCCEGHGSIIRCHRAFFVNISHVVGAEGNSQGYRLDIKGCTDRVPVSRAYTKTVRELVIRPC